LSDIGVTELQINPTADLEPAGPTTGRIPGLLVLRLDGPLYTANVRRVARSILDAADTAQATTVVLDASALVTTTVTVIDEIDELEQRMADRGIELWIAALPARATGVAVRTAGFRRLLDEGRVHPTSLAAARAYLAEVEE
jgi:SulP family sulfate permease